MAIEDENGNLHDEGNGRFTGKESTEQKLARAERIYNDDPKGSTPVSAKKKKAKSKEEFFGEEFKGYKGADAVEKLLKEKRGHIKSAFERPEIGGIDLVWGDEKGGLLHTMQHRDKKLAKGEGTISGYDMVMKIPEIIDKGVVDNDNKGRINIDYDGYRVGILPTIYDDKLNWIVTAMELL